MEGQPSEQTTPAQKELKVRKRALHVVLILSMIGSGSQMISYSYIGLFLDTIRNIIDSDALPLPDEFRVAYETVLSYPREYYLVNALLCAVSLAGVIMMWKPKKIGLHFYAIAQILLVASALLFIGRDGIHLGDVMLTLLFITYYLFALKRIEACNEKIANEKEA